MIHSMSSGLLLSIYPNIFSDRLATNSIWPLSVLGTLNDQERLFRTKTLNACLLAMSDFVGNLLNVSNLSLGCSFRYLITWQQYVQGTIFTPLAVRMACAL
ncbi:hypothetical protein BDR07DRAFT_1439137, partial [Suillus spraguei]